MDGVGSVRSVREMYSLVSEHTKEYTAHNTLWDVDAYVMIIRLMGQNVNWVRLS